MRAFEIALIVTLAPYMLHLLSATREAGVAFSLLPLLSGVVAGLQLALEGYRWQMAPLYGLVVLLILYEKVWTGAASPLASYCVGIASVGLTVLTVLLATALPVFSLPTPSGPYLVGTAARHIIDHSGHDTYAAGTAAPRELMIQIWYPTGEHGQPVPYRDSRITSFKDSHFSLVRPSATRDVSLSPAEKRYPVLLYTPSWSGIRTESTTQVQELASRGYVVVTIDHPYSSRVTAFPDGRIALRRFTGDEDYSSQAAFAKFLQAADEQVNIRAKDAIFVLDTLEVLDRADPDQLLTGRLDLSRVGIFGFSLGGGTAALACLLDLRFKAGANLGGMIAGKVTREGTRAPFLFMFEGFYRHYPYLPDVNLTALEPAKRREIEFTLQQFAEMRASLARSGGYWLWIDGIRHMDFSDSPFFSPVRVHTTHPEAISRAVSRYTVAFFDKILKGIEQPLLDPSSASAFTDSKLHFESWPSREERERSSTN